MEKAMTAILGLFDRMPEGIPQAVLTSELMGTPSNVQRDAINRLLKDQKLEVARNSTGQVIYKQIEAGKSARLRGLTAEDKLVYQCIEQAGNTGLWTKEMKFKTNLQQPQITKILKVLEGRSLVKAIKPVSQPSKKFYMLFDLEPAREITGGAWYTDQDYDSEFINVLQQQCYKFIKQEGDPTLEEVSNFIHEKGISRVQLRDEDVMMILNTLEYDGQIERVAAEDGERFRRALLAIPDTSAFTSVPCGVCPIHLPSPQSLWGVSGKRVLEANDTFAQCILGAFACLWKDSHFTSLYQAVEQGLFPIASIMRSYYKRLLDSDIFCCHAHHKVFRECTPEGPISPATCVYYQQWLDF